jgi:hypothetical protein
MGKTHFPANPVRRSTEECCGKKDVREEKECFTYFFRPGDIGPLTRCGSMDPLRPSAAMESIVEQLQAAGRRVLEGLSEAELRDRIEQLQRQLQL